MNNNLNMVFLKEAFNDIEADIICGMLEVQGIKCEKRHRGPFSGLRVILGQEIGVSIMVMPDQLEDAKKLIKEHPPEEEQKI